MNQKVLLGKITVFILLLCSFISFGQTKDQQEKITSRYDLQKLAQLENQFLSKAVQQKQSALQYAQQRGLQSKITLEDGGFAELQRVDPDGSLIYYRTFNVAAANSTRTNHLNIGGSTGLNLDGQNMIAYVWDGGHARITHQEYDGPGGTNRVSVQDAASEGGTQLNFHSAHVSGTIAASGVVANAKGMAPQSSVRGYMWNSDLAEATTAAGNGMLISNHSYGFNSQAVPDYYFGAYITDSRDWDNLLYNAPYYLMVVAAGNDGTTNYNASPLNGVAGYDKLTGHSTSKNNLVVASANDATIDSNGNLVSVSISSFSSQGPTDDLRIKPDITGNGAGLYSTYDNSDTAYNSISGTSMASPNVTGTLLLLQQHANNVNGSFLRAASLKGVALHTADDAGPTGPDAVWGWGLLNAKKAAQAISQNGNQSLISELTLMPGQTYTINVDSDGVSKLLASISWTDPAGTATTTLNSPTAKLVNDLDIRVTKSGTTYLPWRLTGVTTNGLGDNTKDTYERVDVANATGTYTITVTHKGSLSGGSQNFSLIVTGLTSTPVTCNATVPSGLTPSGVGSNSAILNWNSVAGASYDVRYRQIGTTTWTTVAVAGTSTTISGLTPQTTYEAQVRSKCPDATTSAYSASVNFTTSEVQLNYCASASTNTNDEFIGRVQLNTINNASGAQFYSDFTNISTDVNKGQTYTITITPTWTGTVYAEGYSVWIDYNKDGDFADVGEQVWTQAATTTSPVSGSFTIPAGAADGATRIRISMKYNAIPTSCETFTYGEVEDYTLNIVASGADTQAPSAPTNLTASNITQTTVDLSWTASTDNVGVTGYDVYQGASLLGTVTSTSASITGLTASTAYSFSVKAKDAAGNISPASNTVNVITLSPPDTQAPTAPTNLVASNITTTTVDLSWTASTDNVGVVGYDVYQGASLLGTVTGTAASVTGLTASTSYTFSVKAKDAAGNISPASNTVNVTTLASTITYCNSQGNSTVDEWIQRVQLGSINNNSGNNGGYANYTNLSTTLVKGTSNTITITPAWSGTKYREAYRVWIDYNQDGDFNDSGEQVYSRSRTNATSVSGSFTVPAAALNGATRMRVSMKYNANPTSCEAFAYGEVEDYTVVISATAGQNYNTTSIEQGDFAFEIYPNPVKGTVLNVELLGVEATHFAVFNMLGQQVSKGAFTNSIQVGELQSGVYFIEISNGEQKFTKRFIKQ
ncbi:MAG: peptidase S8 [Flavobacteriaceae bacterium CG18_big_fil_WC_8_21_14_2_50_34_36]|nr:MAG: peptidase S8 [Flavobacteriaceae bacterium CG18_big_fil_WC_8_21_14_2_50_34_36]PIV48483.1 MAG: peptidase S8 [Flavobacteriaceae bacterium CG02_land_8_20_14_3_00_34_13]PIZ07103.1 MAG: peptidase S8 [Flavobacteriaceae bacterium CG_4_10_14_0_8_um_filter_34_31]PJC06698.1 MAG: peptidase S8 [Flavobacteriaceae bacterium CG_4_9_14_0_8_um_filter_34_30]